MVFARKRWSRIFLKRMKLGQKVLPPNMWSKKWQRSALRVEGKLSKWIGGQFSDKHHTRGWMVRRIVAKPTEKSMVLTQRKKTSRYSSFYMYYNVKVSLKSLILECSGTLLEWFKSAIKVIKICIFIEKIDDAHLFSNTESDEIVILKKNKPKQFLLLLY